VCTIVQHCTLSSSPSLFSVSPMDGFSKGGAMLHDNARFCTLLHPSLISWNLVENCPSTFRKNFFLSLQKLSLQPHHCGKRCITAPCVSHCVIVRSSRKQSKVLGERVPFLNRYSSPTQKRVGSYGIGTPTNEMPCHYSRTQPIQQHLPLLVLLHQENCIPTLPIPKRSLAEQKCLTYCHRLY